MDDRRIPTSNEILRSLKQVRSADARERIRAIHILAHVQDDQRVGLVFEYLYHGDPDPRVRQAAWQAIQQRSPSVSASEPPAQAAEGAAEAMAQGRDAGQAGLLEQLGDDSLFLFDPVNRHVLATERRRLARLGLRARALLFLAGIVLVLMMILWVIVVPELQAWYLLNQSGITVGGTITSLNAEGDEWRLRYSFVTAHNENPALQEGDQRIMNAVFERVAVGSEVQVTYWPDDPAVSRTELPDPAHRVRDQRVLLELGLGAIALFFTGLAMYQRRKQRKPGKNGVVLGWIEACRGYVDPDGDYKLRVDYHFQSPVTGSKVAGRKTQIRNDLRGESLPAPDTPVAVYYREDETFDLL